MKAIGGRIFAGNIKTSVRMVNQIFLIKKNMNDAGQVKRLTPLIINQ
ncbi:MAG: hypothetical protein CM15mP73_1090 [Hyphomicrobiales bacterium]|nr:MAG: hypothetical protein CM15mP73_1090 [Hyphomicrobiales bacterium]